MNPNFKIKLLIPLAAASAISSLIIHNLANAALQARAEISRQQSQQLADLQAEQNRLSNQIANTAAPSGSSYSVEIAKLHAEAETLRKQTNELTKQSQLHHASKSKQPASKRDDHSPEYWEQYRQVAGTKSPEAASIAMAMIEYASDHQNKFPSSLDLVAPYLAEKNTTLSGTNQFEIVFQGSLDDLNGIPAGSVALIRDTQTWYSPDGKPMRVYGMNSGIGSTVTSEDNFLSWESEHVIPPASNH